MSVDEVDDNRQSLIAAKTQKDHTLVDEADRNWEQISSKRCMPLLFGAGLSLYLSLSYSEYNPTFLQCTRACLNPCAGISYCCAHVILKAAVVRG